MAVQQVWGSLVIWYLFLAGTGAGVYLLGIGNEILRKDGTWKRSGYIFGPALVGLGTLFLLADLGRPLWAFLAVLRPYSSMISVGTIILVLFILNGLGQIYLNVIQKRVSPRILDYVGCLLAIGTATYTGLLLGVVKAIPFWNHPVILPVLFLISALSSGAGFLMLISMMKKKNSSEKIVDLSSLLKCDLWLILGEIILLTDLFYLSAKGNPAAVASVDILFRGFFALPFWGLFVITGLVIPLAIEIFALHDKKALLTLCGLALFVGGITLRYSIVMAGVWLPLK
ncbi:polysulfide reductase NrfD [Paradesulfitobacterium aromaticivorans]